MSKSRALTSRGNLQSSLTKNENEKYDNSTLEKINRPVAFAALFTACPANLDCTRLYSHPAGTRLACAFAKSTGGQSSAGRRLSRAEHRGGPKCPFASRRRHLERGPWLGLTGFQRHRQLQHGDWCWRVACQYRRQQYGHWRGGAFEQHHRQR